MCGPSKFQKFNVIRVCFWSKKGERVNRLGCVGIAVAVVSLLARAESPAQQSPHERHSNAGPVPLEILERPVTLRTGIGEFHERVSKRRLRRKSSNNKGLPSRIPTFGLKPRARFIRRLPWA